MLALIARGSVCQVSPLESCSPFPFRTVCFERKILRVEYLYINYLEFLCIEDSYFTHLLNYLIFYLYLYSLIDIYFKLWVKIQHYFIYFVDQIVPPLATRSSSSWFFCSFDILLSILFFVYCFWALPYFLAPTRCSGPITYTPTTVHDFFLSYQENEKKSIYGPEKTFVLNFH